VGRPKDENGGGTGDEMDLRQGEAKFRVCFVMNIERGVRVESLSISVSYYQLYLTLSHIDVSEKLHYFQ